MSLQLQPSTILHHRYRIERLLGAGGFGMTYLCLDERLQRRVCIKEFFLSGHCTRGSSQTVITQGLNAGDFAHFRARFSEEARALARFRHPGIVQVLDVFEENNTAYYVMDYVQGETLKALVLRKGRLAVTEALSLMQKLLDAVETVHAADLLHRDIKPDNIIVSSDGQPVLIDFGNARHFSEGRTLSQTAILTPGYAPPEQYTERARRGPFTDVYGLGATLYFALTGMKPLAVTDRQMEQLTAPHQLFTDIPETLSSAVMLAMSINPEDRFQDVRSFHFALNNLRKTSRGIVVSKSIYVSNLLFGRIKKRRQVFLFLLVVMLFMSFIGIAVVFWHKSFPFELDRSKELVESFYTCYDQSSNSKGRALCLQHFFSETYRNSNVAKSIIDKDYTFKKHVIKNIILKKEDAKHRILQVNYNFTFQVNRYSRLVIQKNGMMEISLDNTNKIINIDYMKLPRESFSGSGQGF